MILKMGRLASKLLLCLFFLYLEKVPFQTCLIALVDKTSFLVLQTMDACCKLGTFIFYLMDGLSLIRLVERGLRYYREE